MSDFKYCPECRGEFVPEATVCNTCRVDLIQELPEKRSVLDSSNVEFADPALVYAGVNMAELITVKGLLEANDIPFFVKNDGVQDLFGFGRVTGFNPLIGSVHIYVDRRSLSEARRALKEFLDDLEVD